jgi:hypothetical protein
MNKIIGRYQKVNNMQQRLDGALRFFDMETKNIVYFGNPSLTKLGIKIPRK